MNNRTYKFVDVTDVLCHILSTGEIGGIPRLLLTIIENRAAFYNLEFCVYSNKDKAFLIISNLKSLDVSLLSQFDFKGSDSEKLELWQELLSPNLRAIPVEHRDNSVYYFLSSQWDTFYRPDDFRFLVELLSTGNVKCLHHDSYLLEHDRNSPSAERFIQYWELIIRSKSEIFYISEHTKTTFERYFGSAGGNSYVLHYDFAFTYSEYSSGIEENAIKLVKSNRTYLLVFSILDGRKSPTELIALLCELKKQNDSLEIALILRFVNDNKQERLELIDLILENDLKVFLKPNDATYLWLIKHAMAVYYPSSKEGFGMVPIDCKSFGKCCFAPSNADFLYLHSNIITYDQECVHIPEQEKLECINDLSSFAASDFAQQLFLH